MNAIVSRIFIAGIMQGSHRTAELHSQNYRDILKSLMVSYYPKAEVYDPLADHRNSLEYSDDDGRAVFYRHNRMCREVDVVIAFLPEASMGTAIEMWEAHEHGRGVVIAISPLRFNWAVRYCSHLVFDTLSEFESGLKAGLVQSRIVATLKNRSPRNASLS